MLVKGLAAASVLILAALPISAKAQDAICIEGCSNYCSLDQGYPVGSSGWQQCIGWCTPYYRANCQDISNRNPRQAGPNKALFATRRPPVQSLVPVKLTLPVK